MGRPRIHGESGGCLEMPKATPEYRAWGHLLNRCSATHHAHERYHDRGITVCDEWTGAGGFQVFLEHVGRRPSPRHSLDRIDNEKGYEPGNVRWATKRQQAANRVDTVMLTIDGETKCIAEWARVSPVSDPAIRARLRAGWPVEDAVFSPSAKRGPVRDKRTKRPAPPSTPRADSKGAREVLGFIRGLGRARVIDVANVLGTPYSTAAGHIRALVRAGKLNRIEHDYNDVWYQAV